MSSRLGEALRIGNDGVYQSLQYLTSFDLVQLGLTCKGCKNIVNRDDLWQRILFHELGIAKVQAPPSNSFSAEEDGKGYRETYICWRRSFSDYSPEEIKLAAVWWQRIEAWLDAHAPKIRSSLGPPATAEAIKAAESALQTPIPRLLKLLYRFHDGQCLAFDDARLHRRVRGSRQEITESIFHGLFGGYSYYDKQINMRFLPLESVVQYRLQAADVYPRLPPLYDVKQWLSQPPNPEHFAPYEFHPPEDHPVSPVIFVGNALINRFSRFVGMVEGTAEMDHGLLVNFDGASCLMSACHPPVCTNGPRKIATIRQNIDCPMVQAGGSLFRWLYEYLNRLESGVYALQPIDQTNPGRQMPRAAGNFDEISLFPCSIPDVTSHQTEMSRRDIYVSKAISNGIEITGSAIFIPDDSSIGGGLFWTYRITMRLLNDHSSRPSTLRHCQLTRRHWLCSVPKFQGVAPISNGSVTTTRVDGDGVIGLYPTLSVEYSQLGGQHNDWPFAYQSCSTAFAYPASIGGYVEFAPLRAKELAQEDGALLANAPDLVSAAMSDIPLIIPEFIF